MCRGGLRADHDLGFWVYIRCCGCCGWRFRPYGEALFPDARNAGPEKSTQKGLLLRSALAGSGSFAAGSIRAQRLRFASLHLLALCLAAPDGRCAPTPGSIPPLSLPMSPVDQDQEHSSLRSLLSGAALPRAAALLCFCGSEPAREGGLTANSFRIANSRCLPTAFSESSDLEALAVQCCTPGSAFPSP